MAFVYAGASPVDQTDTATYELGTVINVLGQVTIRKVRVWGTASQVTYPGRAAHLWSYPSGQLLATAALPDVLPPGWSTYDLDAPYVAAAGTSVVASFTTSRYGYQGLPSSALTSADGLTALPVSPNRFTVTLGPMPTNSASSAGFYGVDVGYDAGDTTQAVTAPNATLAVSQDQSFVPSTATATFSADQPGCTFVLDWGDGTRGYATSPATHVYQRPGSYAVSVTAVLNGLTGYAARALDVASSIFNPGGSLVTGLARHSLAYAQARGQALALGAMNSLVLIERRGGYDTTLREYDYAASITVYDTPGVPGSGAIAGVSLASGGSQLDIGDEPQYFDSLTVYLPAQLAVRPRIDDLVTIVTTPDEDLVGRVFRVVSTTNGGRLTTSNQLSCQGVAPSRSWGGQP